MFVFCSSRGSPLAGGICVRSLSLKRPPACGPYLCSLSISQEVARLQAVFVFVLCPSRGTPLAGGISFRNPARSLVPDLSLTRPIWRPDLPGHAANSMNCTGLTSHIYEVSFTLRFISLFKRLPTTILEEVRARTRSRIALSFAFPDVVY